MKRWIICIYLLLLSCSDHSQNNGETITFTGREPERFALYRIKVPAGWKVEYPDQEQSLVDSRLSLVECLTPEGIKITIHNFPVDDIATRIPPQAQLQRWQQQLHPLDQTTVLITPQSFSGYKGLLLEAEGEILGEPAAVMGWALQVGTDHYRTLTYADLPNQMRADVTIKATGSPDAIALQRGRIKKFARSFELIEEIPVSR